MQTIRRPCIAPLPQTISRTRDHPLAKGGIIVCTPIGILVLYTKSSYTVIRIQSIRRAVMSTSVVSVRVRRELKEEAERLGIDLRAVVEKALEEEVRRVRADLFRRLLGEALREMDTSVEEWVRSVRESREER